jgi:hypothetical protein
VRLLPTAEAPLRASAAVTAAVAALGEPGGSAAVDDGSWSAGMDVHAEVTTSAARRETTAYEWAHDAVARAEAEEGKRKGERGGMLVARCAAALGRALEAGNPCEP